MEGTAQGSAAQEHGARLLELWNWDGTLERVHHALYVGGARAGGTGSKPAERTFAWISHNRHLARDFERYAPTVVAFVRIIAANTSS